MFSSKIMLKLLLSFCKYMFINAFSRPKCFVFLSFALIFTDLGSSKALIKKLIMYYLSNIDIASDICTVFLHEDKNKTDLK